MTKSVRILFCAGIGAWIAVGLVGIYEGNWWKAFGCFLAALLIVVLYVIGRRDA